jgi:tRNA nucleotidyltransferase/poly(A) polymerase
MTVHLYEVGGHVRDSLLGIKSKDIDFAVECRNYTEMWNYLVVNGFDIFLENQEYFTIRARFPKHHVNGGMTADFVMCRRDGEYLDGRHPDSVSPGIIFDDLARRDFTVNAMARDLETGELIDPWGGQGDLNLKCLRAVGNAEDRFREDSLRAIRAMRFWITKGLWPDKEIWDTFRSDWLPELVANISRERIREELNKCLKHNTVQTFITVNALGIDMINAIFRDGLRLDATLAS